jgi:putative acyl-CoA dehydrogenase
MRNVLADLALESEAATWLAARVAFAVDQAPNDRAQAAFARIATAIGKYWICKRAAVFVNEAQECLGGAGYVEESMLPRLYRQAPLNSIWEGSGNIQCLDVLRGIAREPETREVVFAELLAAHGVHPSLDREAAALASMLDERDSLEANARRLVERMALALQASILVRHAPREVGLAFCDSRLDGDHGLAFGTLSSDAPLSFLIERAFPLAA